MCCYIVNRNHSVGETPLQDPLDSIVVSNVTWRGLFLTHSLKDTEISSARKAALDGPLERVPSIVVSNGAWRGFFLTHSLMET